VNTTTKRPSFLATVIRYYDQQEAHHRKKTFDQEFVALLKKQGVEVNPNHVLG
jgi:hypothetical protein